jgi:hypothetical protein
MSTGNESVERQQLRMREFLQLLPLTLELAGLPRAELGKNFNEGQIEIRVATLRLAYKHARLLVSEIAKS